jgi:hypothetical protein
VLCIHCSRWQEEASTFLGCHTSLKMDVLKGEEGKRVASGVAGLLCCQKHTFLKTHLLERRQQHGALLSLSRFTVLCALFHACRAQRVVRKAVRTKT